MTEPVETGSAVAELARAFAEFRAANDERLVALERKGSADPLVEDRVERLNVEVGRLQAGLDGLRTAARRPGTGAQPAAGVEAKAVHHGAFLDFVRKGREADLHDLEAKALSVRSDPDGGYLVSADLSDRIISRIRETTPMRQVASVMTVTSDAVEGVLDTGEAEVGWAAELGTRAETETPALGVWRIPVHELYAEPRASQKLLDDAAFDVEGFLAARIAERMARAENTAFLTGDGIARPRGLLSYPTAATADAARPWGTLQHVVTGEAGDFPVADPADPLIRLAYSLKAPYRARARWMMARSTLASVRLMKDGTSGQYLWQPGLAAGAPATLLGHPVLEAEDMPAIGADALAIAFGDFGEAYTIVDRTGLRMLRDPYTAKPQVKFYTTRRVGGDVVDFDAVKLLKFAA